MTTRQEFRLGMAVVLGVHVLLGFSAIALLSRIGPIVNELLAENDFSVEAAETMLASLALPADEGRRRDEFYAALARARGNVTEDGEQEALESIARSADAALAGDAFARSVAVAQIQRLARINRRAMLGVAGEARRLGAGGAWAAACLALGGFVAGRLLARRLERRLLRPVSELATVVASARVGDSFRRVRIVGAEDMRNLLRDVNHLLDDRTVPKL